jgi:hypothetical protein
MPENEYDEDAPDMVAKSIYFASRRYNSHGEGPANLQKIVMEMTKISLQLSRMYMEC